MKLSFFLATAALFTPVATVSAQSPVAPVISASPGQIAVYGHIRTTLHGSAGPVVVLIPGMSTPEEVWDDTVAALEFDHRLLVVEVRGFDGEQGTANELDGAIEGIVAEIAADLEARELGPATIVGHSLGGLIAMKLGLDHPAQAKNLLILDSLPFFGLVLDSDMTMERAQERGADLRDMLISGAGAMRSAGTANTTSGAGAAGMSIDEETRVKIANWSLDAEPLAVAQLIYEDTVTDLREDIARLSMPVTVVHFATGSYAQMARERYATDYAALPTVRLVPVEDSAHFVQLDRPDVVLEELQKLTSSN